MEYKLDCRYFRGDKPCKYAQGGPGGCGNCAYYSPMGTRILIVKLDALGDVARTTTLLPALHNTYNPVHITWLVAPEGIELLEDNPLVDVFLPYDPASLERLRVEKFDIVLSLDKAHRACAVGEIANAHDKRGFGLSQYGTVYPLNSDADYAFRLGLSDELKFRKNTRTYQDIIFQCAGLKFNGEDYSIPLNDNARANADEFLQNADVDRKERLIGINLGGGAAFAHKMWGVDKCVEFVREIQKEMAGCRILLFGAAREADKLRAISDEVGKMAIPADTGRSLKYFQALLGCCDLIVTGDSLGMHLALASGAKVVALFGPTCAAEIEMYNRGEKIVSPLKCAPCYRPDCEESPTCMDAITVDMVMGAVKRLI